MRHLDEEFLKVDRVLILGFGKEGQSTLRFILREYPEMNFGIADRDPGVEAILKQDFHDAGAVLHLGEGYLEAIKKYPLVVKSPGVAMPEAVYRNDRNKVTSQTKLMLKAFHRQIIGVTGTKGKSTTSSLVHHILKVAGKDVVLVGNIGLPPFDQAERVGENTTIVFELSSHQLEDSVLAPAVSVLLNLYPEHLDRYPVLSDYYDAKMKILSGQLDGDTFIYNADIPEIGQRISRIGAERNYLSFSSTARDQKGCFLEDDLIYCNIRGKAEKFFKVTDDVPLKGRHNRMNMMAAILAARSAGAGDDDIRDGLLTFKGLEHRLEYVGQYGGIHFYNDSIATIPESAMAAIRSLPETETIILGGYDRNLDYRQLVDFLVESNVKNLVFMGKAGQRMYELICPKLNTVQKAFMVGDLQEAFEIIPKVTGSDRICLLSPAAASYDIFRNFEERGQVFKRLARSL